MRLDKPYLGKEIINGCKIKDSGNVWEDKMSKYKMVTCDLDGTLFGSDSHVSEENNKAIKEFCEKGIPFVPCTGRTLGEIREVADNPDIRYVIYSSGAAVLDKKTGECINYCLPSEAKEKLVAILSEYDVYLFLHADGNSYIDARLQGKEMEYQLNDTLCGMAENFATPLDDLKKAIINMQVECVCIFFKNEEERDKCRAEFMADDRFMITEPWECNIELFYVTAGKANAIKELAERLDIDIADVISIGDSNNDVEALMTAGLGIAVSNGSDQVKKIADEIACSNDENVAEYVLKKYF